MVAFTSRPLEGKVAIVTGASRGCGRGIALQLAEAGCTLYITGRSPEKSLSANLTYLPTLEDTAEECRARGGKCQAMYVDHSNMDEVENFFQLIEEKTEGRLDILVNNAFSAVQKCGATEKRFYEIDPSIWDEVNNVGLRNQYFCSVFGARIMAKQRSGLIVNISSVGGAFYLFNVAYGAGKHAIDRMSADMGRDLKPLGITVLALWPGAVKTEIIMEKLRSDEQKWGSLAHKIFDDGETIEYAGKGVVKLATDPTVHRKTSGILITTDLGKEYDFKDVDNHRPGNIRSLRKLLGAFGHTKAAKWVPKWISVPGWAITLSQNHIKT